MSMLNFVKKNSSTILSIMACGGVVGTAILAAKASPKAYEYIKHDSRVNHDGNPYGYTFSEAVKSCWKLYIPAAALGGATMFCILSANALNKHQQALIISGCEALATSYRNYRDKVIELHPEVDEEVRNALIREEYEFHRQGIEYSDRKVTFFDPELGISFDMYERELMDAEYHFNRNFALGGHANLYDFYVLLGLEESLTDDQIEYAQLHGWSAYDGIAWIDISHELQNPDDCGDEIYTINYLFTPDEGWLNDWM